MTTPCEYRPKIQISFGRVIGWKQHFDEFQAIEEAFQCLCDNIEEGTVTEETIYIAGTVNTTYIIQPSLGEVQFITVEGDVELSTATPGPEDPKLIILVIADGGDGRFNFPSGGAWTSDANGTGMDGKPWDPGALGGDYGALVQCIWDGLAWVYLVYARHDIDPDEAAEVEDIYNWR